MAAQNLVPNPSFEEYDTCPDNLIQLNRATHWFYVSDGTSDYFNACETIVPNSVSVPSNIVGFQLAHSGRGYAGILFTAGDTLVLESNFHWIEYLAVRLIEPMREGFYRVSFYVSLADSLNRLPNGKHVSASSLNIFNCHFSNSISYWPGTQLLPVTPSVEVSFDKPVTDSLGWTRIESYYYSRGSEEYLIIGPLNRNFNQYKTHRRNLVINYHSIDAYYYYDDVEVIQISENEFPNIFTPNGDGINDEFDLKISCNDCGLQLQIYNRWGQLLTSTDQFKWDGKYNGYVCADGVYYYVLTDTVNKKSVYSGFFQLVMEKSTKNSVE